MMTHNPISQPMAHAAAVLTHQIRKDWDVAGIMPVLERNATRADAFTLIIALLTAAQEPTNRTPAVLDHDGAHWQRAQARNAKRVAVRPADANPECANHPGVLDWQCEPCHQRTPKPENFHQLVEQAAEAARAEKESTRAIA
jgi:hypothetical protein